MNYARVQVTRNYGGGIVGACPSYKILCQTKGREHMAFFEDLGKKVTQTGQEAIKKTKIMAQTTKINSQISAEKRVIADNINKIGERYYELFRAKAKLQIFRRRSIKGIP
jgi:hypothetical protein